MKFRKKPVVIEAVKYQAELGNNRIMNWLAQQGADVSGWLFFDGEITIPTLEGRMKASDGDWIIKGINGEFYLCKPDIFVASYDECVERPDPIRKADSEARKLFGSLAGYLGLKDDQRSREYMRQINGWFTQFPASETTDSTVSEHGEIRSEA